MGDGLRRLALLTTVLVLLVSAAAAARQTLSAARFAEELERLSAEISTASPSHAIEIERTIPAVWTVEEGGRRYDVPAGWLQTALRNGAADGGRWATDRDALTRRIGALAREARAFAAPSSTASTADARAALDRVLADREFARLRTESVLQQLWRRVTDWVTGVLQRLGLGRVARAATAQLIAWTISLIALAALLTWLVKALHQSHSRVRLPAPDDWTPRMSGRSWARRAASAEDIREVVRCAYRAATTRLEEEGVWRVDESRTPREYLRLLPADHRRRRAVADVTRRFEEIWYGARPATDDDRRHALGTLRDLECLPAD